MEVGLNSFFSVSAAYMPFLLNFVISHPNIKMQPNTYKIEQIFKTLGSVKRESICPSFSLVFCCGSHAQQDKAVQDNSCNMLQ